MNDCVIQRMNDTMNELMNGSFNSNKNKKKDVYKGRPQSLESAFQEGPI